MCLSAQITQSEMLNIYENVTALQMLLLLITTVTRLIFTK